MNELIMPHNVGVKNALESMKEILTLYQKVIANYRPLLDGERFLTDREVASIRKKVVKNNGFCRINAIQHEIKAIQGITRKFKFGLNANCRGLVKEIGCQIVTQFIPLDTSKETLQNGEECRTFHRPFLIPQTAIFCIAMDAKRNSSFAAKNKNGVRNMRSTFNILFYVNKSKEKNGVVPVMGRVTINGIQSQFSCKKTIPLDMWDVKGNCAKGRSKEALQINRELDNIKAQIIKHYQHLSDRESFVTAEIVRNSYQGFGSEYETLLSAFDMDITNQKKRVGKDRAASTLWAMERSRKDVADFIQSHYRRTDMSMLELTQERLNAILDEPLFTDTDWSAVIVPNATIDDLDEVAIAKAKVMFKKVHSRIPAAEVNAWSVEEFLSNAGVMIDGGITRAAIILLGKPISVFKLRPAIVRVTWSLRDEHEDVIDYEHFTAPFILTVDQILAKVHNLTMREMPGGTMFPDVMQQYDDYSMREVLHNCIAHQDYTLQERINLVENPGFLYYANGGSFIPGSLQKALATHGPQRHYRNECLCNAMVNFNMIDIVGRGIRKIFNEQWKRHFPMPDYEIDAANKEVAVRLYGNAINEKYTTLLKEKKDLTLEDCILLDAVQKGHRINETDANNLLSRGLVEGEYPDLTISLSIARQTKQVPEYTRLKGLEKDKLKQMVIQFLQNSGSEGARREFIYKYLKDVLPSNKTEEQQLRIVGRLLVEMNEEGLIGKEGLRWIVR